ncbi:MAG: Mur ligase family protein [Candidatus Taylorbacteria bacterium]|nr:Mur ligase family protein [Candidatus Taylorbacteria bacterium]
MNATVQELPKRVHVIGICGVATSALAIAFHDIGIAVSGSDKGFFPPISIELEKHKIDFYAGWHMEKMVRKGVPNIVIVGTASGSQNPETAYAKENGIPIYSFAEAVGKYFAKENSIVCAGTWGKTSSSALLSFILDRAGYDPTYMFGGISLSHDSSAKLTGRSWSVFEGDEYKSSPTDHRAKFFHYKPTHLLLTAISWDHADLYPAEKDYFNAFEKLIGMIPDNSFIVGCSDNTKTIKAMDTFRGEKIFYGKKVTSINSDLKTLDSRFRGNDTVDSFTESNESTNPKNIKLDYDYDNITQSSKGLEFTISHSGELFTVRSPMLGSFQAENITGCFAMAHKLGIEPKKIVEAISQFKGLKRRLEKRVDGDITQKGVTIIDDIAHSPEKASSVLATLQEIYQGKVICIFEPNSGGRSRESIGKYDDAFKDADIVVIPRLTKLKAATDDSEKPIEGEELANIIKKTHANVHFIENDEEVVGFLKANSEKGDVIAFLGSHGFRGMIEEAINIVS